MLDVHRVAPSGAQDWLPGQVRAMKSGDELAPLTVICSSRACALGNRRALARSGSINTRFAVLSELSESLASPLLARRGLSPLTAVAKQALLRRLLADPAAGSVRTDTPHASTVEALDGAIREFRERSAADVDGAELTEALTDRGAVPAAFARMLTRYEEMLESLGLYDDRDRVDAALEAVEIGVDLRDTGAVIVHLPLGMTAREVSLIRAIAARTRTVVSLPTIDAGAGDLAPAEAIAGTESLETSLNRGMGGDCGAPPAMKGRSTASMGAPSFGPTKSAGAPVAACAASFSELHITAAPSAGEEVRAAVRCVLAEHASGVPLYEIAVLHNDDRMYGGLLADVLGSAAVPFTVLGGRPLSDSWAARGLLDLLRLRDSDFSRVSVLAWLNGFPWIQKGVPQPATWERLSREAGVVRGVDSWTQGLERLAKEIDPEGMLDDPDSDIDPEVRSYRERVAGDAISIAAYVVRLADETEPPAEATWAAFSRWAIDLFQEHVLRTSWTGPEAEAGQLVIEILRSLPSAGVASGGEAAAGAASAEEPERRARPLPCTLSVLIETLEGLFDARRQPVGKFGRGILTGKIQSAAGLKLSRVHALGMTESAFPKSPPTNPFVPFAGESDPLDDRRTDIEGQAMALFITVSAAGNASLSFPIWDDAGRPVYPSRWLVQAATRLEGRAMTSQQLRTHLHGPWFTSIPSPLGGVRHGPEPVDLAEYRLRAVLEWREADRQLASHPLAARSDLPLQRFLVIGAARASAQLTAADGNLADTSLDGANGDGLNIQMDKSLSATRLQAWATCPFRYYLDRVLGVRSTDRPEDAQRWTINALDKGSVIHTILERFYKELIAKELSEDGRAFGPDAGNDGPPGQQLDQVAPDRRQHAVYGPDDYERLAAIAAEELDRYEEKDITGHPLVWKATRSAILADLEILLRRDGEDRIAGGWSPVAVEQAFGDMEGSGPAWPAVSVNYGASEPLLFRGKIDRIDRSLIGTVRVTDYKTGRADLTETKLEDDPVVAGTALQLALYGRAVREPMDAESVTARYWYASTKGEFKTAGRAIDEEVDERLVDVLGGVVSGITAGCFPQIPQAETYRPGRSSWENCVYCAFDRICPSGRDAVQDRKRDAPGARAFYDLQLEVPVVEE